MRGFVKGALTGAASFAAGIAVLAVVLPPPEPPPPQAEAQPAQTPAGPQMPPVTAARVAEAVLLALSEDEDATEAEDAADASPLVPTLGAEGAGPGGEPVPDPVPISDTGNAPTPPQPRVESEPPQDDLPAHDPPQDEPRLGPPGVGNAPPARAQDQAEPADAPTDTEATPADAPAGSSDEGPSDPAAEDETQDGAQDRAEAPPAPLLTPARPGRLTPGSAVEGVRVGRLPQVGAPAEAAPTPAAEAPAAALPAWQGFAATVARDARPPLGLVLLDAPEAGAASGAEAAILALPMPVTVALDPFEADAPRRAGLYRDAGHEVVLSLAGVSALATPGDLEVLFAAWAEDFPQALGVIEPPSAGGRRARTLATSLVPVLRGRGLGLVAPETGLSPMLSAARTAGVARAGLYRSLDSAGEDGETLRRQLDRAAFEAERTGRVAVIGQADRAETLAAILAWREGAGARAGRVQVVPVGTVFEP